MKQKQQTKSNKIQYGVGKFFGQFKFGVDFWAIGLFALLMIPNIVWWCYSPSNDPLRHVTAPTALDVFTYIFQAVSLAVLMFVVRRDRERQRPNFDSPFFTFTLLPLVLYYAAWIFYFCGNPNIAVLIFLGAFPCIALACFACLRKNWIALCPIAVFSALHLWWLIFVMVQVV